MTDWARWLAPLAGALLVQGCGGGGGDSGGGTPAPSAPPSVTITASPTSVDAGASSTLTWSSTNATSCTASQGWSGTKATSGTESTGPLQQATSYSLSCTGAGGTTSAQVGVGVNAALRVVRGTVTYGLVPHATGPGNGLSYPAQSQLPARAITVEAVGASSGAVLSTTRTDDQGRYEFTVDTGTALRVRARAELLRAAPLAAPHWNVQVSDVDNGGAVYTYSSAVVPAGGADATQDVSVPSGWDSAGNASGPREAAPFSILDAMYRAMQFVSQADPARSFPALSIDWAPTNEAGETFYQGGSNPTITIAGEVNADTDEYDWHVIIHEYAHYLEDQFSRSDSIGGPHSFGDVLDPRVAFSEGFAYAFAAMVLDDPIVRDTLGVNQARDSHFDVEANTSTNAGWFSESSVQEVVYDYYDESLESNDTVNLPFATLWNVMTGPQRTTAAFTTLFPFVTALRQAAPASAAAIDSRLSAERVNVAALDDFGTGETNLPLAGAPVAADVFPIHSLATIGGSTTTVRSTNKWGTFNALSNSRFLRFNVPTPRSVTITASTATFARDIDFLLYRTGALVVAAENAGWAAETRSLDLAAGDYLLEVYDCNNVEACSGGAEPIDIDVVLQ